MSGPGPTGPPLMFGAVQTHLFQCHETTSQLWFQSVLKESGFNPDGLKIRSGPNEALDRSSAVAGRDKNPPAAAVIDALVGFLFTPLAQCLGSALR